MEGKKNGAEDITDSWKYGCRGQLWDGLKSLLSNSLVSSVSYVDWGSTPTFELEAPVARGLILWPLIQTQLYRRQIAGISLFLDNLCGQN